MTSEHYLISFKLHHVIIDGWSREVLMRDLLQLYYAVSRNEPSCLPVLTLQYKDLMTRSNEVRKANYASDKQYWRELLPAMHPDFLISNHKGVGHRSIASKVMGRVVFDFPGGVHAQAQSLAARMSTTLFVVLQATFKKYAFEQSGCGDIMFGTYSFRREPGTEDQIGCYATSVLIRTLLHSTDSLEDAIKKVRSANEGMQTHTAWSLMDYLEEMLPASHPLKRVFWNLNLQYYDFKRAYLEEATTKVTPNLEMRVVPLAGETNSHIAVDIELNFMDLGNNFELKVFYDTGLYTKEVVCQYIDGYMQSLKSAFQIHSSSAN
jgi:hypothetical protein